MNKHTEHQDIRQSLAHEVFNRIEAEAIAPTPRFLFLLKDSIFWGAFLLSCLIGMVAVAASLFVIANAGFRFYAATHDTLLTFFIEMVPLVWILSITIFVAIAYYNFRHTRHGYRYPLLAIIAFSILASIGGGVALHFFGFSQNLEEEIGMRLPFNRPVTLMQKELWMRPQRGLLAGEIIDISTSTGTFRLAAFDGQVWEISSDDLRGPDFMALEDDRLVRVVGVPIGTVASGTPRIFHACFMFPWDLPPPPQFNRKHQINDRPPHFEHEGGEERSEDCRSVVPYHRLKVLQE